MPYKFTDDDKVAGSFFNFEKVGSKVQGTYVGKSQKSDNFNPGMMQQIYELLTEEGDIVLIGGKVGIDMQMKHIKLGQIIELKFLEERPTQKGSPAKIIQVFANPNVKNEEWLKEQGESIDSSKEESHLEPVREDKEVDVDEVMKEFTEDSNDKLVIIGDIAKEKLQVTGIKDMKIAVAEATGLAVIKVNYDKIIEAMNAL